MAQVVLIVVKPDRLGHRVFLLLAGLFVVFVAYVSWRPPVDDAWPYRGFFTGLKRLGAGIYNARVLRDLVTNVILYIPLGVFVASALAAAGRRLSARWLLAGFAVTAVMETGQHFLGRVPDALDIITNTIGYVVGYGVVALLVGRGFNPIVLMGFDPREDIDSRTQSLAVIRFLYVCVYVMVALIPFDLSVNYSIIYRQLLGDAAGVVRIIPDPLYHLREGIGGGLWLEFVALLPIAVVSALLNGLRGRSDITLAVFPCVAVVVVSEVAQLFIQSRTTDIVMLPLALLAGVVGWLLVRAMLSARGSERECEDAEPRHWRGVTVVLILYAFAALCVLWWPYQYELDYRAAAGKFRAFFEPGIDAREVLLLFALCGGFGVFAWLLSGQAFRGHDRIVVFVLLAAAYAVFAEASRFIVAGYVPGAANVVAAACGALAGAGLVRLFRPNKSTVSE